MAEVKTEKKTAKIGDVWDSGFRRTTIVGLIKTGNGRMRVKYKGKTGAESTAWADVYLMDRTLVERDGKAVK